MSYAQYTKCVHVKDKKLPVNPTVWIFVAAIVVLLTGGVSPYTAVPLLSIVIGYCLWWLYDRLVCLGGVKCAIGYLGTVEPPEKKSGFDRLDTDYSINLLLAPHQYQELPANYLSTPLPPPPPLANPQEWATEKFKEAMHRQIADDGIQGDLIKEQTTTSDVKTLTGAKRYDFEGYFSTIGGSMVNYHHQAYLHCEFEGRGMLTLMEAAIAALAFATAAAVACAIPFFGFVACAILSGIAAIISLVGVIVALNDTAKPEVVENGKTSSELHTGKDILFVKGDWVFDTAHEGWNEIHPIHHCRRLGTVRFANTDVIDWEDAIGMYMVTIGRWKLGPPDPKVDPNRPTLVKNNDPPKPDDWRNWVKVVCDQTDQATAPLTIANQARPENQWTVHPAVDGCRPAPDNGGGPDLH